MGSLHIAGFNGPSARVGELTWGSISALLRDDVYAKFQDIIEHTGLTLSGALALLIMRVDIEQLSKKPRDTRAWTLADRHEKKDAGGK